MVVRLAAIYASHLFTFAPVRELVLAPWLGLLIAERIELVFLSLCAVIIATILVRRSAAISPAKWLVTGLAAAVLIIVADIALGVGLRGMTLLGVFLGRPFASAVAYYAAVSLVAIVPMLVAETGLWSPRSTASRQEEQPTASQPIKRRPPTTPRR